MDIYSKIEKSLLGLNSTDTKFAKELQEVKKYYEFYEGRPETIEDDTEDERGQLWKVKTDDYKPTREIRNITKKLMKKQKRFMTAVKPDFIIKSIDGADVERVDNKKAIINKILNEGKFWNKFSKAFLDCTIGKRVMLCLITDIDDKGNVLSEKPIRFRFYTMPEFTYEYDPNDCDKLIKVQIAYQDETTIGKLQTEQRWHKWIYEMRGNECWATYQVVDGINTQAYIETVNENGEKEKEEIKQDWNTGLNQLPCKIIFNDGLTGDVRGHSDIKDLMDMAMDYNRTISDYRDALKFKMFEQDVFVNADPNSIAGIKIAPGSIIDLKGDQSLTIDGNIPTPTYGKLTSAFNFQTAADSYLTGLKKDMYELMDQPLPESLVNVASGKALRMLNDDLIGRCEEKWQEWDDAFRWLIDIIIETVNKGNLYRDVENIEDLNLNTSLEFYHNYPIPDDETETKELAMKEVEANVRSHQSYIRDFGEAQEADKEFEEILDEQDKLNMTLNSSSGLDDFNAGGEGNE